MGCTWIGWLNLHSEHTLFFHNQCNQLILIAVTSYSCNEFGLGDYQTGSLSVNPIQAGAQSQTFNAQCLIRGPGSASITYTAGRLLCIDGIWNIYDPPSNLVTNFLHSSCYHLSGECMSIKYDGNKIFPLFIDGYQYHNKYHVM